MNVHPVTSTGITRSASFRPGGTGRPRRGAASGQGRPVERKETRASVLHQIDSHRLPLLYAPAQFPREPPWIADREVKDTGRLALLEKAVYGARGLEMQSNVGLAARSQIEGVIFGGVLQPIPEARALRIPFDMF